jgi:hypothetical protein
MMDEWTGGRGVDRLYLDFMVMLHVSFSCVSFRRRGIYSR